MKPGQHWFCTVYALLLLSAACGELEKPCSPTRGFVTRVIDGDTIELRGGERVRYLLVDTPELSSQQCYAQEAKQFNTTEVLGHNVRLEYPGGECRGYFGRLLPYVYAHGLFINREVVARGLGRVSPSIHPEVNVSDKLTFEFLELQKHAQSSGLGLWGACR
ncbi:MAG: thermonuclease family protein [Myxococcota bacterium]